MQNQAQTSFRMSLSTLFRRRSAHRASDETTVLSEAVNNNIASTTTAEWKHHKRNSSGRIFAGLFKIFPALERNNSDLSRQDSAHPGHARAPTVSDPSNASRTTSLESQQTRTPSLLPRTTSSADRVASTPASPDSTPPSTDDSEPLASRKGHVRVVSKSTVASPIVKTATAKGVLETPINTPIPTTSAAPAQELSKHDLAMAAYAKAEEMLAQRHAGLKAQPDGGKEPKKRLAIIKKATADETIKVKKTRTKDDAYSPAAPAPSSRRIEVRRQPRTAGEAAANMQRRDCVMNMAYNAMYGCKDAQVKLDHLNAHFGDLADGHKPLQADIIVGFGDYHFRANKLGHFEHNWIDRYNALCILRQKHDGRIIGVEDYEFLQEQLFPDEETRLLTPEYLELFLEPLAEEGILTKDQVVAIGRLGVTQDELESGLSYTPPAVAPRVRARQAANLKLFHIPERTMRTGFANVPGQPKQSDNLHWYLRVLVEAAVYKQAYYRGFFFGHAASTLNYLYRAYKLSKQDKLLPPTLTEYNRPWTYAESRLLERGQYLCDMLKQYDAGTMTDFGVIRIVRATFVHIPGQPRFHKAGLEQLLYSRISGAGIPISSVPDILSLLPDNDIAFSCPRMRQEELDAMNETAAVFEAEEAVRLAEIAADQKAYRKMVKKELGAWGRVKRNAKGVFCKKKKGTVKPFNAFSPEHGSLVPADKDDGSIY